MKKTIIISLSVIAVGVLAYFGYKWYKKDEKVVDSEKNPLPPDTVITNVNSLPTGYVGQAPPKPDGPKLTVF